MIYFIKKFCDLNHLPLKTLSHEAEERMRRHEWRGNVRELENTMHRAVLLSDDVIQCVDIFGDDVVSIQDSSITQQGDNTSVHLVGLTVAEVERHLILKTLDHCLGNRTHAATILGISIRTLRNKLKEYDSVEIAV